jgi:hypothetical protein
MLSTLRRGAAAVLATAAVLTMASTAAAEGGTGGVQCDPTVHASPGCTVAAGTGGQPATTQGGGSSSADGVCRNPSGQVIACEFDGGWAGADGCYYKPTDPSPATVAALGGQPAGAGGWYLKTCLGATMAIQFPGPLWIPGPPPALSPQILARQARARLSLPPPVIGLNPAGDQLVGLPTWLSVTPASWQSRSATAAVPGVSVTATARPVTATWLLGDGTTVVCHTPGTAWAAGMDPAAASPDCGHVYRRSSATAPGGTFTVTVTIAWQVSWAGAGQGGTIAGLSTTATIGVRVQESQAVITR